MFSLFSSIFYKFRMPLNEKQHKNGIGQPSCLTVDIVFFGTGKPLNFLRFFSCHCMKKVLSLFCHSIIHIPRSRFRYQSGFGKLQQSCSMTGLVKWSSPRSMALQTILGQISLDNAFTNIGPLCIQSLINVCKNHSEINTDLTPQFSGSSFL